MGKGWLNAAGVLVAAVGVLAAAPGLPAGRGSKIQAAPVTVATRRITESQYRNAIADILGPDIRLNARFEPGKREGGLLAIGNSQLSLTSGGFEQYFAMSRSIAEQARVIVRSLVKPQATLALCVTECVTPAGSPGPARRDPTSCRRKRASD